MTVRVCSKIIMLMLLYIAIFDLQITCAFELCQDYFNVTCLVYFNSYP